MSFLFLKDFTAAYYTIKKYVAVVFHVKKKICPVLYGSRFSGCMKGSDVLT